jgi:ABC-2 type transport system ATP-binding protein
MSVIHLNAVCKRFGRTTALSNISLEVPAGGVFALLGDNGAGKTTAIRILLGMLRADQGQVSVLGLPSAEKPLAIRRRVGYVSERPVLYEWMTTEEIGWFTEAFYANGFRRQYARLIDRFQLDPHQRLDAMSKGMRAKVSLALALAPDPELLILDEPTSGLDPVVRREFLESMVERAAAGKTVFLSSHQLAEVERVADRVAILRGGRLAMVAEMDALKRQVREVTVTLREGAIAPPVFEGRILHSQFRGRQWQAITHATTEQQVAELNRQPQVQSVKIRVPNLEEIFLALMK